MVVLASALNARAFLQQDPDVAAGLFERSKKNFERAKKDLSLELGLHLFNRWKGSAEANRRGAACDANGGLVRV